ncbi:hypothetical protein UFOVP219_19 [uncultured Caudovirales phage]|uniref:Uncharacterized protein n=1 Tax=uncultured Caudovirales phage TaxID=2100421 RepID=A0A6J7WP07_9CAUD|nr:hypothetical protein UFOVP219_19 [uncultured Caudovirales phage]
MAVVKVTGVVGKVFGATSQGLSLKEEFVGQSGEKFSRSWSVWFAVAHGLVEGAEVTVFGQLSYKIEEYVNAQGQPGRKVAIAINNAQVEAKSAPAVSAPF